jgi:putative membrane protein
MNADKSSKLRWLKAALWVLFAFDWMGGVGSHLVYGATPANMSWAAPVFLLLASLLVVAAAPDDWRALLISFTVGFAAEAIGVATGYPFGVYVYSTVLAPSVLGVPPVMAGAWMILIAAVRQLRLPFWAGAAAMVSMDLVIDPLAANTLAFWKWRDPGPYYGIPFVNFFGWLLVSLLILWILRRQPRRNPEIMIVGCSILLFFALLALAHGYFAPAALGVLLCGAGYWRWRSSSVSTRI